MALTLGDNFSYQGAKPLDGRIKYDTLADMKAVADSTMYEGCLGYCVADGKTYQWKSTNTVDSTTGKWREFTSGGGGGASDLSDLSDVDLSSPSDGQYLKYDGTSGKWVNAAGGSVSVAALGDIGDVDLSSVQDGQIIKWDSASSKWVNANIPSGVDDLNDLSDVNIGTPTNGQVLTYDLASGKWVNQDGGSATIDELGDIGDVDLTSLADGQIIKWDATNSKWVNASIPAGVSDIDDLTDVEITSPSAGQILTYDATNSKWVNGNEGGNIALSNLTDTDINSPAAGDVLKYDGENFAWANSQPSINDNTDVAITTPSNGDVLKYNSTTQKWENGEGGGGAIVNGYAYTEPFEPTTVMDYINWIRNHTDKTILVPNENIFSGKTANCLYMVLGPAAAYLLFSEFPFNLKVYYLNRSGTRIFNSTRLSQDGTTIVGFNSNGTFTYANGITQAKQVSIHDEVDCDYLADNDKEAQLFVTPNINLLSNMYKDNTVVIENQLAFYSDSSHTTLITPVTGKFYVDTPTGDMYEWDGTEYKQIGSQDVPKKTSDLVNDSGFITNVVNDLVNYYLKTETYSKTEVDTLVAAVSGMHFEVVSELPTTDIQTNAIYLVPSADVQTQNIKDEYINLDGTTAGWEQIGSTAIDLSGYVTTTDLNTALADYTTTANLTTLLSEKQDKAQFGVMPTASIDYAGRIVQFTGVTDSSYTHGYFYECKESDGSYSWVQTNVQSSSGGGGGSYTAGDGIVIDNDEISVKEMAAADMSEVITRYPSTRSGGTVLKQTLTAGGTTVTFTGLPTTGDHIIDFFNSLGVNYTGITPSSGQVVLTFPEQQSNMDVYCEIREV